MTGPMGGAWYPLGGAISDAIQKAIPGVTLSVMPAGGSATWRLWNSANAISVLPTPVPLWMAFWAGPFKKKMENMRQLANLYPQYFQMVVPEDLGIKSVADMKGKALAWT